MVGFLFWAQKTKNNRDMPWHVPILLFFVFCALSSRDQGLQAPAISVFIVEQIISIRKIGYLHVSGIIFEGNI